MNTEQLTYQIALTLIKGIGNITAKLLVSSMEIKDIFFFNKKQIQELSGINAYLINLIIQGRNDALLRAREEVDFIVKNKITPVFITDAAYPYRLRECVDAPVIFYSKGNQDYNTGRFVGIVGTRKITEYGKEICADLISNLSQKDITIVSGLAYGVDIHAHKNALDNGFNTIGVLGHSLDRIYPSLHRPVAVKMVTQGGLISEYVSGTKPDKQNFVQRNRIIAGLVDALVVVESAQKGGSLITAEIANTYNRDVFAFPGRTQDEYSIGCNSLIKNNKAALIESASDLEKMMGWEANDKPRIIAPLLFTELSDTEKQIVDLIRNSENMHINQLALKLELSVGKLSPLLLELEFKGLIKCLPGNLYKRL